MDFVLGVMKFCLVVFLIILAYFVSKTAVVILGVILAVAVTIGIAYLIYSEVKKPNHESQE